MGFVFGEVDAILKPDPTVLFDDKFENGPCGWTQLMGGGYSSPYSANAAGGGVGLVSWPSKDGNSLEFHSEDVASSTPSADPMVTKRLTRPAPDSNGNLVIKWKASFAYRAAHDTGIFPRAFDFGLDTGTSAGARNFGKFRLNTTDGSNTWQIIGGDSVTPIVTDIPNSGSLVAGINEGKAGFNELELYFDLAHHTYLGLIINGNPFGTYVGGPALPSGAGVNQFTTEPDLGPFRNGLNFCFQIRNRTDGGATTSKTWMFVDNTKGSVQ